MTDDELEALKQSLVRVRSDMADVRSDVASCTAELIALRKAVDALGSRVAIARVTVASEVTDPMSVTGRHAAVNLAKAESVFAGLGIWKAKPALLLGLVSALVALAVGFGLPVTGEQKGLILGVVAAILGVVANTRAQKTTDAAVAAASLAVAPESMAQRSPSNRAPARTTYGGRPRPGPDEL